MLNIFPVYYYSYVQDIIIIYGLLTKRICLGQSFYTYTLSIIFTILFTIDRIKQINTKLTYTIPVSCGLPMCYPEIENPI